MAKTAVSQWDATPNNNTDVGGISLAENVMQPPAVNDAFREMMAQIASGVVVKIAATTTVSAYFQLAEATNNGTNKLTITPTTSLTADRTATFPDISGTVLFADAAQTVSAVHTFSAAPVFSAIPSLTGGAIQFPATQVASADANALDDYEEGLPTNIAFSGTGCTFNYASGGQYLSYTKVGNRVIGNARLELATSGNTLAANTLSIINMPFANGEGQAASFKIRFSISTTSYVDMVGTMAAGSSSITVVGLTAAGTAYSAVNASTGLSATGGSSMAFSFNYKV